MSHDVELTVDAVLDDLEGILRVLDQGGAPLPFGGLQERLTWQLRLHLLSYIRFFEEQHYIDYDRISDRVSLTDMGTRALEDPDAWAGDAERAFSEHFAAPFLPDATSEDVPLQMAYVAAAEPAPAPAPTPAPVEAPSFDIEVPGAPEVAPPSPMAEMPMSTDTYTTPHAHAVSSAGLYERHDALGSGGIGTVYRGTQQRLQRPVAIKEIRDIFHVFADVQRDDIVQRFIQIVQRQATLSHANIAQVLDVVTDEEYPYVVMQLAPKGNLRRLIDVEGRPPLTVAMRYFMQILHALNTAHDQGVIHGGLKPENVVLDSAGNALLTDFGLNGVVERASSGGNQVYMGVGTITYMSPEQFRDPNQASVRSDIYSLGIMFYEMLTGKVPGRRSPMPSSFYPDIPRKLDDIFDKMSMDSEEDRFNNIAEILQDIYASPEVMKIMDKRSGVLFLRDPLVHGEHGLGKDVALEALPPEADAYEPVEDHAMPSFDEPLSLDPMEERYEMDEEPSVTPETSEAEDTSEEAPEAEPIEIPENVDEEGADVLDKLDKYGALFDDD